jgi:hypothetical protein
MQTVDFDTLNLQWLQPSRTHTLDSTCSPSKALQLTIFPLLRNGKTVAELCVMLSGMWYVTAPASGRCQSFLHLARLCT